MSTSDIDHDPDDMFKDTRMSFADHIDELRTHLLRAIKGFVIGMLLGFWPLGQYVLRIIVDPVEDQLYAFEQRKIDKELLDMDMKLRQGGITFPPIETDIRLDRKDLEDGQAGRPREPKVLNKVTRAFEQLFADLQIDDMLDDDLRAKSSMFIVRAEIPNPMAIGKAVLEMQAKVRKPRLSTMHITEAFMVYFKIALMTGFVISSPWVFYHVWMFIAAGLYPHEKKLVNIYLPFSLFLFIGGVVICQFFVMPKAVAAMLWFNEWLGMSADLRLNEWLTFALMMPIVFGLSFQTPIVMMFLHRVGIFTIQHYRDYRRISWMVMAVFAALITPSIDPWSMLFLWAPMIGLYELGILLCVYQGEQSSMLGMEEEEKSNELVEV